MLLLTAMLLGAAPVHVVAVHGSPAGLKLLSAKDGTTVDGTQVHAYLHRTLGMLQFQDFSSFGAGPIRGWPGAEAEAWTKGVAHCRSLAGPPPWSGPSAMMAAVTCGQQLSEFLWQRYAASHGATRVFEVDVFVDSNAAEATVHGETWEPGSDQRLVTEAKGRAKESGALLEKVVATLLQRQGERQTRKVVTTFGPSAAGAPDPFAGAQKVTAAVPLKKTCATLPAKLEVSPPSIVGESLVARWSPADASGAPLACTLAFSENEEDLGGQRLTVVSAIATCGATTVSAQAAKSGPVVRSPVDILSERLAQNLAGRLCK